MAAGRLPATTGVQGLGLPRPPPRFLCESRGVSDVDWPQLKANLSLLLGVHSASQHIWLDYDSPVFNTAFALFFALEANGTRYTLAENECILGLLCLKLLAYFAQESNVVVADLRKVGGELFKYMQFFVFHDWPLILLSGWPLFRMMSKLEQHMSKNMAHFDRKAVTQELDYFKVVEASLQSWRAVPSPESFAVLANPEVSKITQTLSLLALADASRPPRWSLLRITNRSLSLLRRASSRLNALIKTMQPSKILLSTRPLFQFADRLSCVEVVELRLPGPAAVKRPLISVLPFAEKVSDAVRACHQPYCDFNFMELALRAAAGAASAGSAGQLRLFEIGANLGDCTVWAAAHFGKRLVQAVLVEPVPIVAAAARRTFDLNSWQERVHVIEALASSRSGMSKLNYCGHSSGNPFAAACGADDTHGVMDYSSATGTSVRSVTLAELLKPAKPVHTWRKSTKQTATLLKVWAYGDLLRVLNGAPRDLGLRVDAVWVAFAAYSFRSPTNSFLRLVTLFRRWHLWLSLPDFEHNWCRAPKRDYPSALIRQVRAWITADQRGQRLRVLNLVASRRGSLRCSPWVKARLLHQYDSREEPQTTVAPWCSFGLSKRQEEARRFGFGYESYFLGHEFRELEAPIPSQCNRSSETADARNW